MKRTIFLLASILGIGVMSAMEVMNTDSIIPGVSVDDFDISRNGKFLTVEMEVGLNKLDVNSNRAVLLTPRLVNGEDSVDLPSIGIYGRRRYYYYMRNGISTITGESEISFRESQRPSLLKYDSNVPYEDWMDGATLRLYRSDWGCCHKLLAEYEGDLGKHSETFFPPLVFEQPKTTGIKTRSLSGKAFIDFPVDQTVIYPEYRRNTQELGKIQASIDSVRNDADVTITSVWLKGFASPESPYKHNTDLAIGRTAALKKHIGQLYNFEDGIIQTDYEPEDWEGLRRFVEQSNIDNRDEILALIDSDMEPDAKELKIKKTYPETYKFMLQNFYPALRHTDYRIDYFIRRYNDVDEMKEVMKKEPQKLDLDEYYVLAETYEPGSDEFTDVFDTAVRMYPNDETANLNAANAAIRRDDFKAARKYLEKAGNSAEALYARGALAVREGKIDDARRYLEMAKNLGLEQAAKTLDELNARKK